MKTDHFRFYLFWLCYSLALNSSDMRILIRLITFIEQGPALQRVCANPRKAILCVMYMCACMRALQPGLLLQYTPANLRSGFVFLNACMQYGPALRYVSSKLREDKDVVVQAIQKDWRALQFASKIFRGDKEVLNAAFKKQKQRRRISAQSYPPLVEGS